MKNQDTNPFDYVKSITETKQNLLRDTENDDLALKGYNPYLTKTALSFFPDTIMYANMIDQFPNIPKRAEYEFLLNIITPRKRYSGKWPKSESNDDLELVMEVYNVGVTKAKTMLSILTREQIDKIKASRYTGGKNAKSDRGAS